MSRMLSRPTMRLHAPVKGLHKYIIASVGRDKILGSGVRSFKISLKHPRQFWNGYQGIKVEYGYIQVVSLGRDKHLLLNGTP